MENFITPRIMILQTSGKRRMALLLAQQTRVSLDSILVHNRIDSSFDQFSRSPRRGRGYDQAGLKSVTMIQRSPTCKHTLAMKTIRLVILIHAHLDVLPAEYYAKVLDGKCLLILKAL